MEKTNNNSHCWKYSNKQWEAIEDPLNSLYEKYPDLDVERVLEKLNYSSVFYGYPQGIEGIDVYSCNEEIERNYPFIIFVDVGSLNKTIYCTSFPDFISCLNEISIVNTLGMLYLIHDGLYQK